MGYEVYKLQDTSEFDTKNPTIVVQRSDPEWDVAYNNWLCGKTPTDDPNWKNGVYAITREKTSRRTARTHARHLTLWRRLCLREE